MNKIVMTLITAFIIMGNILLVYCAYMIFYPFHVADVKIEVTTPTVRRGECAYVKIVGDKYYNVASNTSWYLVDGASLRLSEFTGRQRPVGHWEDTLCIVVPDAKGIVNQAYKLQLNVSYDMFPLRKPIMYSYMSSEFQLVN